MKYGEMKTKDAIPKTDASGVTISLSGLIDGFSNYAKTALRILRHPFKFPETLDIDGESAFHNALSLVFYSITLLFFFTRSGFRQVQCGGIKGYLRDSIFGSGRI